MIEIYWGFDKQIKNQPNKQHTHKQTNNSHKQHKKQHKKQQQHFSSLSLSLFSPSLSPKRLFSPKNSFL